ncbi:hypothetical protein LELG_00851 [Lodderomyces elongisporus NRRL YB-4239]|uniref:Swi5-domain-containing protein n=1 Tax=Lodderomyces elongisporus (strain ATCC 11503 / CBS 2605 / JCM 1781 / NBRC 1676 / NRRL YB-4239) TaxID=379508 RepID=A5DU15_LODEL|nr:hypothetical protein LELG_00851 [Lodderomyces elongisporus NRRL YB-4239]
MSSSKVLDPIVTDPLLSTKHTTPRPNVDSTLVSEATPADTFLHPSTSSSAPQLNKAGLTINTYSDNLTENGVIDTSLNTSLNTSSTNTTFLSTTTSRSLSSSPSSSTTTIVDHTDHGHNGHHKHCVDNLDQVHTPDHPNRTEAISTAEQERITMKLKSLDEIKQQCSTLIHELEGNQHPEVIIKRHIQQLKKYNELKDVALQLVTLIADQRQVRTTDILDEMKLEIGNEE